MLVARFEAGDCSGPESSLIAIELNGLMAQKHYIEFRNLCAFVPNGLTRIVEDIRQSVHPRLQLRSYLLESIKKDLVPLLSVVKDWWKARRRYGHDQFLRRRSVVRQGIIIPFTQCSRGYFDLEHLAEKIAADHKSHRLWISSSNKAIQGYCNVLRDGRDAALEFKLLTEHESDPNPRARAFDCMRQPFLNLVNSTTSMQNIFRLTRRTMVHRDNSSPAYRKADTIVSYELTRWKKDFLKTLTELEFLLSHRVTNADDCELLKINNKWKRFPFSLERPERASTLSPRKGQSMSSGIGFRRLPGNFNIYPSPPPSAIRQMSTSKQSSRSAFTARTFGGDRDFRGKQNSTTDSGTTPMPISDRELSKSTFAQETSNTDLNTQGGLDALDIPTQLDGNLAWNPNASRDVSNARKDRKLNGGKRNHLEAPETSKPRCENAGRVLPRYPSFPAEPAVHNSELLRLAFGRVFEGQKDLGRLMKAVASSSIQIRSFRLWNIANEVRRLSNVYLKMVTAREEADEYPLLRKKHMTNIYVTAPFKDCQDGYKGIVSLLERFEDPRALRGFVILRSPDRQRSRVANISQIKSFHRDLGAMSTVALTIFRELDYLSNESMRQFDVTMGPFYKLHQSTRQVVNAFNHWRVVLEEHNRVSLNFQLPQRRRPGRHRNAIDHYMSLTITWMKETIPLTLDLQRVFSAKIISANNLNERPMAINVL